jgi:hypothetical protein
VLLVNVHQLDIVLANAVVLRVLEDKVQGIRSILGLESKDVIVLSTPKHLRERREIDAEGYVTVAAKGAESFRLEVHRNESDMRVVHSLQSDPSIVAVKVAVLDEVFDCLNNLFEDAGLF